MEPSKPDSTTWLYMIALIIAFMVLVICLILVLFALLMMMVPLILGILIGTVPIILITFMQLVLKVNLPILLTCVNDANVFFFFFVGSRYFQARCLHSSS